MRKTGVGVGKGVVSLRPVVTEISHADGIKMVKIRGWFPNALQERLEMLLRLVSNDSSSATNITLG